MASSENWTVPKDINILLLGESGSGKSLFINSFAKYKDYEQLSGALSAPPTQCIIPTSVVVADKNYQGKHIQLGVADSSDATGHLETTSSTVYEFDFDSFHVRLIDSPGIGGTGRVTDDQTVLESILKFVSQCGFHVNSVAVFAKSNQSKFNREFQEIVRMLLGHMDSVFFLLSHSGDTDYRPGDVMQPLQELLRDNANIKLSKKNIFCFDNKGFRYMLMKQSGHGEDIEFVESYHDAWKRSAEECKRLIQHLDHSTPSITPTLLDQLLARIESRKYLDCCSEFQSGTTDIIFQDNEERRFLAGEQKVCISQDIGRDFLDAEQGDLKVSKRDKCLWFFIRCRPSRGKGSKPDL